MTELSLKIQSLAEQGMSYNAIRDELKCSKGTISYYLGAGQKKKNTDRQLAGRRTILNFLQAYKQARPCTDCKENYPYWMMEFDHLGDKKFNIGSFRGYTRDLEKIKQEIAKCEVVCSNCHKNRTHFRSVGSGDYTLDISESYA